MSSHQRHRAYSDPSSPISSPSSRVPSSSYTRQQPQRNAPLPAAAILNLTQESLARLQLDDEIPPRPRWAYPGHHSHAGPSRRMPSVTPSTTSVSDGEDDEIRAIDLEPVQQDKRDSWLNKGKGKEIESVEGRSEIAESLPPEILIQIFRLLDRQSDILSCLKVNKTWCLYAFSVLWNRPSLTRTSQVAAIARTLNSKEPSLPYATAVKRINLSGVTNGPIDDYIFTPWKACVRAERLTMGQHTSVTARALRTVLRRMPKLVALDLSKAMLCDDSVIQTMAKTCGDLQGLNINGCVMVGDEAMKMVAEKCTSLRRLKVNGCLRLSDESLTAIAQSCPLLLEVDLAELPQLTSSTIHSLLLNSPELRELKVPQNTFITSDAIPNVPELYHMSEPESEARAVHSPTFTTTASDPTIPITEPLRMLRPKIPQLNCLKVVDLTNCTSFGDDGLKNLIDSAPKIRFLTLAKCALLTDEGVKHIAKLGKYIHHLHMAHTKLVTDAAVIHIVRACTRLRYVDFACCDQLTDLSVHELATNLPKLRRVGLVKVINVTDEAIYALVERGSTIERLHLSYCDKITVKAVSFLLNKLPRLVHLSLTGIGVFKVRHLQQFCRLPPPDFNEHQQKSFCVFSGDGVRQLRNYLNNRLFKLPSDDESIISNRRDSGSSASSGVAEDGRDSALNDTGPRNGDRRFAGHLTLDSVASSHRETNSPGTFSTLAARRSSAQAHRDRVLDWAASRPPRSPPTNFDTDNTPLEAAFASSSPNFLSIASPSSIAGTSSPRRPRDRLRAGERTMPGSFSSAGVASHSTAGNERQTSRPERALPPLPTTSAQRASIPTYAGVSAADLARHRAARSQRDNPPQFSNPFIQSGPSRSEIPRHAPHTNRIWQGQSPSNGTQGSSSSSRPIGGNSTAARSMDIADRGNSQRISEAGLGNGNGNGSGSGSRHGNAQGQGNCNASPLRWMAGIVGWNSDREREAERERQRLEGDDQDGERR